MASYRLKGTSGEWTNRSFPLEGRMLIGRADDCAVRIDHEDVAAHHAEILIGADGGATLRDLGSSTGIRVNGERVSESALFSGDEIQLGPCRLMLQAPGLRPERVLTEAVTQPRRPAWPWLLPPAVALAATLAWQQGWLEGLLALFQR